MAAVSAHVNEGSPANPSAEQVRWRDPKRYAWLLGLIVPTLPFLAWGLVEATGLGVFWFYGPVLIFGIFPLLDALGGLDPSNPPDSVIKWLGTGPLLPPGHLRLHPDPVRGSDLRLLDVVAWRPVRRLNRSGWR